MKHRYFLLFVLLLTTAFYTKAQTTKQTTTVRQVWMAYMNQTRLSEKWGIWTDFHLRTKDDFVKDLSLSIIRLGGTYYFATNTKLTAGYAYVNFFPTEGHANISQPEHRIWQQLQWHTNYSRVRTMQWIRLEERFRHKIKNDDELADGYNFNYRLRYNLQLFIPLNKNKFAPKTFSWVVNDEILLNFGKEIINNYFDQNRFFTGLAYHVNDHDNFQFGYSNVFQQLAAGNRYRSIHVIRLFYFHNMNLRKKEKGQ
ncbi:DUF2490 domain-containing protein [Xanthocytophaga agilis]|uniref:DUF2490 domain-containing protein n=1 Tax=Xanthocytophaga agilis TaxID=3048010 RepID=A0AAE3R2B8_9BACT|nr:DUF2490 domain-containing protein [Xanthocytophaga agilis]MDJ1502454.1 DUF2490 domain-containing protein [Xanthocytophaga agilis]